MPPLKNGSLGRGLGELMGGLPDTIGVAKHETVPAAVPPRAMPPAPAPVPPPAAPTRHRLMVVCTMVLSMGAGAVIAWLATHSRVPPEVVRTVEVPVTRIVVVTNTIKVAVAAPEPSLVVDAREFAGLEGRVVLAASNGTLALRFESPLFSSRIALDPDQECHLKQVGAVLARHAGQWVVTVMGHTDAAPLKNGGACRDNEELGLARAMEVARYLSRQAGVPLSMLHVASAGARHPPFPDADEEGSHRNRTVTLEITGKGAAQAVASGAVATAAAE